MAEKGFFESLIEDVCKDIDMHRAIEASRDKNGKIDPYKAGGIAMGMGFDSSEDICRMGALLGAEGAFNDD